MSSRIDLFAVKDVTFGLIPETNREMDELCGLVLDAPDDRFTLDQFRHAADFIDRKIVEGLNVVVFMSFRGTSRTLLGRGHIACNSNESTRIAVMQKPDDVNIDVRGILNSYIQVLVDMDNKFRKENNV